MAGDAIARPSPGLMKSLQKKLGEVERMSPKWSIYRVPKRLRQVNPDAYTPHLVSIGPFHHKEPELADMQEHKWRYMLSLLRRAGAASNPPAEEQLESCAHVILNAEMEVRDWYAATIDLAPDELAKVLLLDGCFVLELFFRHSELGTPSIVENDPVFQLDWMLSALRRDMALLENQIPFFVLKRLFYMVVEHNPTLRADYLPIMAFNFFHPDLGSSRASFMPLMEGGGGGNLLHECKHLLDLLLKCHLPWPPRCRAAVKGLGPRGISTTTLTPPPRVYLRNVKSLVDGGVVLQKAETNNLFDFKFADGVLHIPHLHIHEWTDSLFRNLIAFEHCCPGNMSTERVQYIVSYIILMDRLIETREDVELLKQKNIITVELGGSEDVTNFFKDIGRQVIVKDFYFNQLCEEVEKYYKSKLRVYLQDLRREHFKSPWKILSLFAGLILLACTILQAVYTVEKNGRSSAQKS